MRLLGMIVVLGIAYLNPTRAIAQHRAATQHQDVASHQETAPREDAARPQDERELESNHKHHDPHHGHKHIYPDRGAIFREVPRGTVVVNYAGLSYRFHDGVWFQPQGSAFIVVAPPIGIVVPTLPGFATPVENGGKAYLYANDTYYRARPELGGYEVVNDPVETVADGAAAGSAVADAAAAATPPSSASAPTADAAPLPATAGATAIALPAAAASLSLATPTTAASAAPASAVPASAGPTASTPPAAFAAPPTAPVLGASSASAAPAAAAAPTAAVAAVPSPSPSVAAAPLQTAGSRGPRVFAYPKNGQSSEQQAADQYECYRFGVAQSGFDPMGSTGAQSAQTAGRQADFDRAQAACFDGRGYTVR